MPDDRVDKQSELVPQDKIESQEGIVDMIITISF